LAKLLILGTPIAVIVILLYSCESTAFDKTISTLEVEAFTRDSTIAEGPDAWGVSIRPLASLEPPKKVYIMQPPRPIELDDNDEEAYVELGKSASGLLYLLLGGGLLGGGAAGFAVRKRKAGNEESNLA
jgi:hypothetical protein